MAPVIINEVHFFQFLFIVFFKHLALFLPSSLGSPLHFCRALVVVQMGQTKQTTVGLSERDLPLLHTRQPQAASGGEALEQRQSGHVSLRQHKELPDYNTAPENH